MKKLFTLLTAFSLLFGLIGCSVTEPNAAVINTPEIFTAKVTSVVDGDTIKISYGNKTETARLLLIDTPETKHPSKGKQPFGPEASDFAKKTLNGKTVKIETGVSKRDKYDRLLVYIYLGSKMFNQTIIEKGLARVAYVYKPNTKYLGQLQSAEKKAKAKKIGIWSIPGYAESGFITTTGVEPKPTNGAFASCAEARAAGKTPLLKGQPGYSERLDGDKDGVACE